MKKNGAMTMKYLLTFILAGVLLALVIYGVYNKGFGPLVDNIGGRIDEVLILFHIKDAVSVSCGEAFLETIEGVGSGMFYPCADSCGFVLDGSRTLNGFNNFSISKDGPLVSLPGGGSYQDDVYSFGSAEAQRYRDAYLLLNKTISDYVEDRVLEWKEFVRNISFDPGRTFCFEIEDYGENTAYRYNEYGWKKGQIKNWKFDEQGSKFLSDEDVFNAIFSEYGGTPVYLDWAGFDNNIISQITVRVDKGDFRNYFYEIKNSWDNYRGAHLEMAKDLEKYVRPGENSRRIYDKNGYTALTVYPGEVADAYIITAVDITKNNEFITDNVGLIIAGTIVITDEKYEDVIALDDLEKNYKFVGNDLASGKFVKKSGEEGDYSLGNLSGYGYVDFLGEKAFQKTNRKLFNNGHSFLSVEFVLPSGESFGLYYKNFMAGSLDLLERGMYYENLDANIIHNGKDTIISKEVIKSDKEWEEFIKILKIYEHFKLKRCIYE